jgi:hypothetical protein
MLAAPGQYREELWVGATLAGATDAVAFLLAAGANPNFRVQPCDESPFEAFVTMMVSTWDNGVDDALLARYRRIYASYLDGNAKPDITPRFREQLECMRLRGYGPRLQPVWDAVLRKIAALPEAKPPQLDFGAGI